MKVTDEMIAAFRAAENCACHPDDEDGVRIQAVLDLIDPVPDGVDVIYDGQGDWWRRGRDRMIWHADAGGSATAAYIACEYGGITWEGKP